MKTELNTALVSQLYKAMAASLAIIDREENKLYCILQKAWQSFKDSKAGSDEYWNYFDESGFVKRRAVIEFREACLAAGEKGGYSRTYISDLLRNHVSEDFVLRASAARPRQAKSVEFSKAQLKKIEAVALKNSLPKSAIKALLSALVA